LTDDKVTVVNTDAFVWVGQEHEPFDAVVIDFPDPGSYSVGKLYTTFFYRRLRQIITSDAVLSIQCTSPLVAAQSYWCILRTMEEAGFYVRPYCTSVPTFGVWGFALASQQPEIVVPQELGKLDQDLSFLNASMMANLFELPRDIQPIETEINQLNNQVLVRYYDEEWRGRE
jgi:spermidine synthase